MKYFLIFLSFPTLGFDFKRKIEFFNELLCFFKNSVRYQCIHSWISTMKMKDVSWGRGPRGSINCITAAPWSLCNFSCLVRCGQGTEIPVFSIIQGEWTQSSSLIEVHGIQGTLQNLIYCTYSENLQLSFFSYFYKNFSWFPDRTVILFFHLQKLEEFFTIKTIVQYSRSHHFFLTQRQESLKGWQVWGEIYMFICKIYSEEQSMFLTIFSILATLFIYLLNNISTTNYFTFAFLFIYTINICWS